MMLALRSDLVDMDRAKHFRSRAQDWEQEFDYAGVGGKPVKLGWLIQDLNPEGACGNAAAATAEKGEQLFDGAARRFAAFLKEFDALSADGLDAFPG